MQGRIVMKAKIVFLFIGVLIYPSFVLGYGSHGHANQQLRLIAISLIEPRLTAAAMDLTLPSLPTTVVDDDQSRLSAQLKVLAEEGLLSRQPILTTERTLTADGWVTTQQGAWQYDRPLMIRNSPVRFGRAQLQRTGEIWVQTALDQPTQVEVHFQWTADHLAEWLWAPAFDQESRLNRLKASASEPIRGTATLIWQNQRWQLAELKPYSN